MDEIKNFITKLLLLEKSVKEANVSDKLSYSILNLVEKIIKDKDLFKIRKQDWFRYLEASRTSSFLLSLKETDLRYRWAETTFVLIKELKYSFKDLFKNRVKSHPKKVLFKEFEAEDEVDWTYLQIDKKLKQIASCLIKGRKEKPRVAIICQNGIESACCDLACLIYGIFISPINVHSNVETLKYIFEELDLNLAIIDSEETVDKLLLLKNMLKKNIKIYSVNPGLALEKDEARLFQEEYIKITPEEESLLDNYKGIDIEHVSTCMFTSGSTGMPKGVAFTNYNLTTKRFARAAALPEVGPGQVFLAYLPLFHTFGRFLEMLGVIFWNGTYVFAGNPSYETFISKMKKVQPTALISIPIRWVQIRNDYKEQTEGIKDSKQKQKIFREIVGSRLYWGLSAAGYLDPKVFKFFQRESVNLCSGFGMTEGTGGITMTPPHQYKENTVGTALPGVRLKFTELGEMHISGPYIARYLDEIDINKKIDSLYKDVWLPTGDIFTKHENGYLEIVDRIKDIYKNSKGQTVAPKKVEKEFEHVPGIKSTFLVGDGRDYNVLLIVQDSADTVIANSPSKEAIDDYFSRIIIEANLNLPPYERVINFSKLPREFDLNKKELTPKGSFNRKQIETNFKDVIDKLYKDREIRLKYNDFTLLIPLWVYRDLGILEDGFIIKYDSICNSHYNVALKLAYKKKTKRVQIGDLEYFIKGKVIDLGAMIKQPRLWASNPAFINFFPCKEGWDSSYPKISKQVALPKTKGEIYPKSFKVKSAFIKDKNLANVSFVCSQVMFYEPKVAMQSILKLETLLEVSDARLQEVIKRRLEACAYHFNFDIRGNAYRILLMDQPGRNYSKHFPSFLDSGLPFLDDKLIDEISQADLTLPRLSALRQRMHSYRITLKWPTNEGRRRQFSDLFKLLVKYVQYHPEYYSTVRSMLIGWIVNPVDHILAASAEKNFNKLKTWLEKYIKEKQKLSTSFFNKNFNKKVLFTDELTKAEKHQIKKILTSPAFIEESLMHAFDAHQFNLQEINDHSIWISRISSIQNEYSYRISITTAHGKHYNLQLIIMKDHEKTKETIQWMISENAYPREKTVLPAVGAYRRELNAFSLAFVNELTTWQRIQSLSNQLIPKIDNQNVSLWENYFTRSFIALFTAWINSEFKIVPGIISPNNIIVSQQEFREDSLILSLLGWKKYKNTLSLIRPIIKNFYLFTINHYPWCKHELNFDWLFNACVESLGREKAIDFLCLLRQEFERDCDVTYKDKFLQKLDIYIKRFNMIFIPNLSTKFAIDRYHKWLSLNSEATYIAKCQIIEELCELYKIHKFADVYRFYLYRKTYFKRSSKLIKMRFDKLIHRLHFSTRKFRVQMEELSELQDVITEFEDRVVFSHLVFPKTGMKKVFDVSSVGYTGSKTMFVKSEIEDLDGDKFVVREPVHASEIGILYKIFIKADFPKKMSEKSKFILLIDHQDEIVGGISYGAYETDSVEIDGIIIVDHLKNKGLGTALLDDFISRMKNQNVKTLRTPFLLVDFFQSRGFVLNKRWGGLVKKL
ncbi:MAG: GNAT family N-acetyltransferase [Pseudomonadota bacterium]